MRLSKFTRHSLHALAYIAACPRPRVCIAEVAQGCGVAEGQLVKVVHFLGRQGWLRNVRGHGGGVELASDPLRIRIGAVVRATEGDPALAECFEADGACCISPDCRARGALAEAVTAFYAALDRYTLADLVPAPREGRPAAFDDADRALVGQLHDGFQLGERPFAAAGQRVGLPEEEVIERLRDLVASGVLARFGPVYVRGRERAAPARRDAAQMLDAQLVAATRSGLPLVPQPYEALGAMLGVSSDEVQARLAALLARGVIRRIGAVIAGGSRRAPCSRGSGSAAGRS